MRYQIRRCTPESARRAYAVCFPARGDAPPAEALAGAWWAARDPRGRVVAFACARASTVTRGAAYFERVGVLPRARGVGLQRRLMRVIVAWARQQGYQAVISYTLPYNHHSSNNFIRAGWHTYGARYAGRRAIYWRKTL